MAKQFQFDEFAPQGMNPHCAACEELLTDAVDGLLSPADQAFFDLHLSTCTTCMSHLAEAKRGAAWLELLKTHRPEPSGALMQRILAQTAGQETVPASPDLAPVPINVLPFVPRRPQVSAFTRFTRLAMEPRLAMTAAMAFFSIALTLNLMGVRFDQIHTADLKPSNIRRNLYEAKASAVRYSDNLRVVRVLESRVDDMRQSNEDDSRRGLFNNTSDPEPQQQPAPEQKPAPAKKPAVPGGTSRRESPIPATPTILRAHVSSTPDRLRISPTSAALRLKEGGLV